MDVTAGHPRRWPILIVMVVAVLLTVLDGTIINVGLRTLADPVVGLGATHSELEWAINSFTLVFAGLLISWGVLGDRYGHRRMLVAGLVIFGISSVLAAYSDSAEELILWRAVMGLGAAAIPPTTLAVISRIFPPAERPKAIGIWAASSGIAGALGPIAGGLLLDHFWWGSIFLINAPIVLAALVGTLVLVPGGRDGMPEKLDPLGVLLSLGGITLLVYGLIEGGRQAEWTRPEVLGGIIGGLVLLGLFVLLELRISHPALDVRLFADSRFSASATAVGLAFFAIFGITFFMVFYLQSIRGYDPLETGLAVLPLAVGLGLFAPHSPGLAERFGFKRVVGGGLFLASLCFFGYLLLEQDSPLWLVLLIFFLQGAGMAHVMPPATEAIMSLTPQSKAGVGASVTNVTRNVGGALGIAVLGSILATRYRDLVEPHLGNVPAGQREAAGESIEATYTAAARLGPQAAAVADQAREAFMDAMHLTAVVGGAAGLLGALVVFAWMPGRNALHEPSGSAEPPKEAVLRQDVR